MSASIIIFDAQYISEQVKLLERAERLMQEAKSLLKNTSNHEGWKCHEREIINDKIGDITKQLGKIDQGITTTAEVLSKGRDNFLQLEDRAGTQAEGMAENIKNNYGFQGKTYGQNRKTNLHVTQIPPNRDEGFDILAGIKSLLSWQDKAQKDTQAGLSKAGIDYIDALYNFFTKDKCGFTGAKNFFNLLNKSEGVWSKAYKHLKAFYNGAGDIFSLDNQKKVGGLDILGSTFGLVSSVFGTIDKIKSEKLGTASAIGEIIKTGSSGVDLWGSIERLIHLGDKAQNITTTTGVYSPLTFYTAMGKGYINAVSQGFKSVDKYAADGVWDLSDTGRTGIEVGVSGLYSMADTLTFGISSGFLSSFGITADSISADIETWADNRGKMAGDFILNNDWLRNAYQNSGPIGKTAITLHSIVQSGIKAKVDDTISKVKSVINFGQALGNALFKH